MATKMDDTKQTPVKAHHVTRLVETKNGREGKGHETRLTWDFSKMSRETLEDLASRTLTINWQRETRAKMENGEKVPGEVTLDAEKWNNETHRGPGAKLTPEKVLANAEKLAAADPKATEALIKKLQESLRAGKK